MGVRTHPGALAPVASLPSRELPESVHFSMARSVHFSVAIDKRCSGGLRALRRSLGLAETARNTAGQAPRIPRPKVPDSLRSYGSTAVAPYGDPWCGLSR